MLNKEKCRVCITFNILVGKKAEKMSVFITFSLHLLQLSYCSGLTLPVFY